MQNFALSVNDNLLSLGLVIGPGELYINVLFVDNPGLKVPNGLTGFDPIPSNPLTL